MEAELSAFPREAGTGCESITTRTVTDPQLHLGTQRHGCLVRLKVG